MYKRQIQNEHSNIVRIEEDGRCVLNKEARKDTQEQLDAMQFSMQGIYAVSYTHLDVYKRQRLYKCSIFSL